MMSDGLLDFSDLDDEQRTSVDELMVQISLANLTILRNKIHYLEDTVHDYRKVNDRLEKKLKELENK
jgi:hypothetical protein